MTTKVVPFMTAFKHAGKHVDRVLAATLGLLLVVAAIDSAQALASAGFVWNAALKTFPFLVLSVALAAYARASGSDNLISRAFRGPPTVAIGAAALMGALSPFCSCGVIPVIAALLSMGVPIGPVMAFWLASPLMDPSMFVLTVATLGSEFALAKTLAAVGVGLLGGMATQAMVQAGWLATALRPEVGHGGCAGAKIRNPKAVVWNIFREPARVELMNKTAVQTAALLGKWLLLAFLLESLMVAWLPADFVGRLAGGEGLAPIVVATLIGVPSYLNGYAALPLVSGMIEQGLAPGAGMAFLVSGGVTSLPAALAVWAVATPRMFGTYIALAFLGAVLSGVAYAHWLAW